MADAPLVQPTHSMFNPTHNRPLPWWCTPDTRQQLLDIATSEFSRISPDTGGIYIYSKNYLTSNFRKLQSLKSIDRVFYATKANSNPELLRHMISLGCGIECVSIGELRLILSLHPFIDGNHIMFTPNFASKSEYIAVLELFQTEARQRMQMDGQIKQVLPFVNIDNMYILETWDFSSSSVLSQYPLFLRVDPGEDGYGHHSHVNTGLSSKFGMPAQDITRFFSTEKGQAMAHQIVGLHMHKGSGLDNPEEWANTSQMLLSLRYHFPNLQILDLGGGLGVPYKPSQFELNLQRLDDCLLPIKQQYPQFTFCIEPGRYIVAVSGILLARVNQLKRKAEHHFIGLSVGMNALIRPALYESYHHIVNLSQYHEQYLLEARQGITFHDNQETTFIDLPLTYANGSQSQTQCGMPSVPPPAQAQCSGVSHPISASSSPSSPTDAKEAVSPAPLVVNVVGPICESGDYLGKLRLLPNSTTEGDIILIDTAGAYGFVMASPYNLRLPCMELLLDI